MKEFILIIVFIFSLFFVHTKLKGTKVYDFITLLALPFIMSYLFANIGEMGKIDYFIMIMFAVGFVYNAVKFYNKYLKESL